MTIVDQVGRPTPEHVAYASELLARLPDRLRAAAREPTGAQAIMRGLLLPTDAEPRATALSLLQQRGEPSVHESLLQLLPDLDMVGPLARLPLIDLSLPALRRLTPEQYRALRTDLADLTHADQRVELFEWMLQRVVLHHLEPHFGKPRRARVRHRALHPLLQPLGCLLSALAHAGDRDGGRARAAYGAAWHELGNGPPITERSACSLESTEAALDELSLAAPPIKKQVLEACVACIAADRHVEPREAELLRAVADALDCPMPPLLPGQPLT